MTDEAIRELLKTAKTIAVVGLSNKQMRPGFGVSQYLQAHGYRIIPVNPGESEVLGERAFATLAEVPGEVDIVDIFRRSEHVPAIVEAAIAKGVRCVWMQEGITHAAAAAAAERAGVAVVMDHCLLKEHRRLMR